MKSRQNKQYTIRNISPELDHFLRQKAKKENKNLNETALEALRKGTGFRESCIYHDLDFMAGSWEADPQVEQVLTEQRLIDQEMWK